MVRRRRYREHARRLQKIGGKRRRRRRITYRGTCRRSGRASCRCPASFPRRTGPRIARLVPCPLRKTSSAETQIKAWRSRSVSPFSIHDSVPYEWRGWLGQGAAAARLEFVASVSSKNASSMLSHGYLPGKPSSGTQGFAPTLVDQMYTPRPCFCFASLKEPSKVSMLG